MPGEETWKTPGMFFVVFMKQPYGDLVGGFNHLEKYESQWEG
jgi:hypothetical protein